MLTTRKPASVGEILTTEFLEPMALTQGHERSAQARQRTVHRSPRNTADTALILARVFGNSAEFWLNVQRRVDLWEAMNTPKRRKRIERAAPIAA